MANFSHFTSGTEVKWETRRGACTRICTVCLHLEQAFETLLEEMKLDTDVLEETFTLQLELVFFRAYSVTAQL